MYICIQAYTHTLYIYIRLINFTNLDDLLIVSTEFCFVYTAERMETNTKHFVSFSMMYAVGIVTYMTIYNN